MCHLEIIYVVVKKKKSIFIHNVNETVINIDTRWKNKKYFFSKFLEVSSKIIVELTDDSQENHFLANL